MTPARHAAALLVALAATGACSDGKADAAAPVIIAANAAAPAAAPARGADFEIAGELTQGGWIRGRAPAGTRSASFDGAPLALAPDGSFIAAFDRDAGAEAKLEAVLENGGKVSRTLAIAPRAWRIEHVAVGPRPGAIPSEEYRIRRASELERIKAARAISTGAEGWRQQFVWPAKGRLSGLFGSQRIYRGTPGAYHSGTDIATGESGTPFVAPADGVVILAAHSPFTLEGKLLMLDHGMGLNSAFLHCSEILVNEGDTVRQGQVIGRIGATGRATGPHLHWSMKWQASRLDPILFAGPMR